ncbi:MAG: hypothetical protein RIQ60_2726 [Pseudomonadota bacterium]|jgi:sulfur carrier protein
MIEILLIGAARRLDDHATLADVVGQLGRLPNALATAVNGEFVARAQRAERCLQPGDQVTTF